MGSGGAALGSGPGSETGAAGLHRSPPVSCSAVAVGFVGGERESAVQSLLDLFHVGMASGPKTVLLSGPAGWGKTRIVHEFYQQLAAAQEVPYWPSQMITSPEASVLSRRKRSHPVRPPDAVPAPIPWMWWGLNGQRMDDGSYLRTIRQEDSQWFAHVKALDKRLPIPWRAWEVSKSVGTRAPLVGSVLGCFLVPVGIASAVFSGLEEAWNDGRDWILRREGRDAHGKFVVQVRPETLAKAIGQLSRRLGPATPIVIYVEDAQYLDPDSLSVLRLLSEDQRTSILMVLATQSDVLDVQRRNGSPSLGAAIEANVFRVDLHIQLDRLSPQDFAESVRARFPQTDPRIVSALAERFAPNPLALDVALEAPAIANDVRDGAIVATTADVRGLPTSVSDLYWIKWMDMPENIRRALATASMVGPEFSVEEVVRVGRQVLNEDFAPALDLALTAYAWLREDTAYPPGCITFSEETTFMLSVEGQRSTFGTTTTARVVEQYGLALQSALERDASDLMIRPDVVAANLARCVLRARDDPHVEFGDGLLGDAAGVVGAALNWTNAFLFEFQAQKYESCGRSGEEIAKAMRRAASAHMHADPPRSLHVANRALRLLPLEPFNTDLRRSLYELLGLAHDVRGELKEATVAFERVLRLLKSAANTGEETAVDTERLLSNFASHLVSSGDYERALAAHTEAYESRVNRLGEGELMTLVSLRNVARTHAHMENYLKNIQGLIKVKEGFESLLGPGDEESIEAEAELGRALWRMACEEDGLQHLTQAATTADREVGVSSVIALKTHLSLGTHLAMARDFVGAEREEKHVLATARAEWPNLVFLRAGALEELSLVELAKGDRRAAESYLDQACAAWRSYEGVGGAHYIRARLLRSEYTAVDEATAGEAYSALSSDLEAASAVRFPNDPLLLSLRARHAALALVVDRPTYEANVGAVVSALASSNRGLDLAAALYDFGVSAVLASEFDLAYEYFSSAAETSERVFGSEGRLTKSYREMAERFAPMEK
jgi:tetratricopeptide (TPR) repeat protein